MTPDRAGGGVHACSPEATGYTTTSWWINYRAGLRWLSGIWVYIWSNVKLSQTNSAFSSPSVSPGEAAAEQAALPQPHIHTDEIIPLRDRKILQQYLALACSKGHKQRDLCDSSIWASWKSDSGRAELSTWSHHNTRGLEDAFLWTTWLCSLQASALGFKLPLGRIW